MAQGSDTGLIASDSAERQTPEGQPLFIGIGRAGKVALTRPVKRAGTMAAARVLRDPSADVPFVAAIIATSNVVRSLRTLASHGP